VGSKDQEVLRLDEDDLVDGALPVETHILLLASDADSLQCSFRAPRVLTPRVDEQLR
jgi:hypothetical protein